MAFNDLLITEIFHSLQGETSLVGVPFAFIRMSGCNLRCTYCDSSYAFKGGKRYRISEVIHYIRPFQVKHVLLTGGEPLLQRQTPTLIESLSLENYQVSIETHGEISLSKLPKNVRIIMDIKTPSSGMSRGGFQKNFQFLKPTDEVKFVIASKEDYLWAKTLVLSSQIPTQEILFSSAVPALNSPGSFPGIEIHWLAEKILQDRLPVRLQIQLHKYIWGPNRQGI